MSNRKNPQLIVRFSLPNRTLTAAFAFALLGGYGGLALAAGPQVIRYNLYELPSARAAMQTLARDVSILWEKKPLRAGLQHISATHRISIWLDRRIDPNQLVNFRFQPGQRDRSLGKVLRQIATSSHADAALIENVVYFGPNSAAAKLQNAAVELHDAISRSSRNKDAQLRPMQWSELSTPNDLLGGIAKQWNIEIDDNLPHDLLHKGELIPPCTLATQLSLVCGGFNMQANWKGPAQFQLSSLCDQTRWQCTYRRTSLNPNALKPAEQARLIRLHVGSSLRKQSGRFTLVGTTRFHLAFTRPHAPRNGPNQRIDNQPWNFEVRNKSAEVVINSLAASIGFDVTWDTSCTVSQREQLISFDVSNANIDKLLEVYSEATNLNVTRTKSLVTIRP